MPDNNNNIRFKEDLEYRIYRIKHLGKKYGWMLSHESHILTFKSREATLRIDVIKLVIETELTHPKKGETRLLRHGEFSVSIIERIFRNPRVHTPEKIKSEYISNNQHC